MLEALNGNGMYSTDVYRTCREMTSFTGIFNSTFKEPDISREASEYFELHYNELINDSRKMGIDPSKVEDMVNDVFIAIKRKEDVGEGYDSTKGKRDDIISVRQYIYGMLKGYSRNRKYKLPTEGCLPVKNAKTGKIDRYEMNIICATSLSSELDSLTACQVAYNTAESYDNLAYVEAEEAFEEELNYILQFDEYLDFKLSRFLMNIEYFKSDIENVDMHSLLGSLAKIGDEFKEAFANVVKFSGVDSYKFNQCLSRALSAEGLMV